MDRAAMSSRGDSYNPDPQSTASPDPEARGRKRRRDPLNPFALPRHQKPSGESSTLRGRCRHRSPSRMHLLVSTSTTAAAHAHDHTTTVSPHHHHHRKSRDSPELSPAPEKRRLMGVVVLRPENRRRNQCPSRSRSPGASRVEAEMASVVRGQRRRQRTQSRSRRHGLKGAFASAAAQAGRRPTLGFDGWVTEHGAMEKD